MKIILAIANSKGRNVLFINEFLTPLLPEKMAKLIKNNEVSGFSIVKTNAGFYIRKKRNTTTKDNLGCITISDIQLENGYIDYSSIALFPAIKEFEQIKVANITLAKDADIIRIDDKPKRTKQEIEKHLQKYKKDILEAARNQTIDQNLLGAILIDEFCRMGFDDMGDWLALLNINTSSSVAQIKLETAKFIIRKGYYTPDSNKDFSKAKGIVLYPYLRQAYHSIQFAAAIIKFTIDYWNAKKIDISEDMALLAFYYSAGWDADKNKISKKNKERMDQIVNKFYPLAKVVLSK